MGKNRIEVPLIEFLKNKIYLGAYDSTPIDTRDYVYFTVEDALPYNSFHLDFGPLNIGNLYRFAVVLHAIFNEDSNQGKAVVLYSSTCPKQRSNAACLLCCYLILLQDWSPHQVLQPISQCIPPFSGFRDAGYSNSDYEITIQDIVYAMWRAKQRDLIDIKENFNLEEYEQYERVDQGDFNIISKDFIAFASPQQKKPGIINEPFKKVLRYFQDANVQLVVRLNSHLYDSKEFTKRGIKHIDMIFDDGTCPTLDYVAKFIGAAECIIQKGGRIAVHCKAGLGRTGCLIGAHLIYTHGFTANECIAYMRMIRPGMVVGPQQHWLYLHQNDFRDWRFTMCLDNRPCELIGGLNALCNYDEFKSRMKEARRKVLQQQQQQQIQKANSSFGADSSISYTPSRRRKISGALASKIQVAVPIESPGQPRKYVDEESNEEIMINNSDDENTMQDIIHSSPRANTSTSTPKKEYASEWKVLRSISNNNQQPMQLTKTTTTTTTRTISTTLSSSPSHEQQQQQQQQQQTSPTSNLIIHKSRSNKPRIGSNSSPRVHSGGIRKLSGKKY
ncbi:unnamed protein product [Candida verbasci]|uniref:Tyrosine-protein phosphatase CDC14 n=1 Tax=Candida verbasci TaxID=1227364 RepID=A0A9W4U001_9ASCO|nr:unnamed protein product [Candida verbasci]